MRRVHIDLACVMVSFSLLGFSSALAAVGELQPAWSALWEFTVMQLGL